METIVLTLNNGNKKEYVKGIKFKEVLESLKNDYQSGIVSGRYNNKIMNDDDVITKNGKLIIYDLNSMEGNRIYERGLLYLFEACATEVLGKDVKIYVKFSIDRGVFCKIDRNVTSEEVSEINALKKIKELLDNGKPARQVELTDEEKAASRRVEFRIKTNSDKIVQQFQKAKDSN